jgi:rhodanese-related sulfurtransferase
MKQIKFWTLSIFTISLLLVSCGETVDESQVLVDYMESVDSPINVESINKLIGATGENGLNTAILTGNPYIIDIRGEEYSTIGHIEGAVQVPAKDVISHLNDNDLSSYDKVVVVCYTGQTAAYVVSLANMAGHEAVSLGWGMSSWNEATAGPWNNGAKNDITKLPLETTANPKGEEGALPVFETGFDVADEILAARISEVNDEGFDAIKITASEVWEDLDKYYIVNYWPEAQYNLGHIPGAIQYTPNESMLSDAFLKTLPTDKTIVVYCYTGQGSAFLTAYLRILGYDAKSLLFGINGFATDWAASNDITHWTESNICTTCDLSPVTK